MDSSGYNSIVLKYHCKVLQYFGIANFQSITIRIAKTQSIAILIAIFSKYCNNFKVLKNL